ncbi:heavy-metal-associated domain-containing protein [Conexibacter sp. CPCC 206217]|uniref:heavy-metal-associated domain-containing protein n=1 Tax=Conexibacter sp. CPCC 206217 TaxID=3064574 RepID=UPI002727D76D|nr:heavy metal-associated domain-containing protein [Conexibacter sp. CPCC 206217]MDO8210830.1 heavy metal-associated domain-containing protein [Conexibacter sp. CPCC 206217]
MSTSSDIATSPRERIYTVGGMTCEHCVLSVREEVSELEGVELVEVDLASGRLRVGGPAADSQDAIRAAVEAAGYTVVSS